MPESNFLINRLTVITTMLRAAVLSSTPNWPRFPMKISSSFTIQGRTVRAGGELTKNLSSSYLEMHNICKR
jgi:hypothetical protein